jgi:Cu/Ag efflux protein CusF
MSTNLHRLARRGAALLALAAGGLATGACSNAGNLGEVLGSVLGGQQSGQAANQVSGVVRGVDTRSSQIGLQLSNGQTVGLQYDANTQVVYNNQRYNVTSLDQGDQVTARIQQNGNAYYTDLVQVDAPVQGTGGTGTTTTNANVQSVAGTVRQIDTQNGLFTLNTSNYGTLTVSLPYNVSRADQSRFANLRSGDSVRLYGVFLNNARVELRQFY